MPCGARGRARRRILTAVLVVFILLLAAWTSVNAWAYYQLRAANRALENHRLPEARERLRLCRKVWRTDLEASFLAARTARRSGDLREARRILTAMQKRGDLAEGVELERDLLAAQSGDLRVLNTFWPLIEENHPETCMMLEAACQGYAVHKRWPETLLAAHKLARLQPDNPIGWYWFGYARDETNEIASARECYQKALDLDPESQEVRLRLAFTLLSLNAFEEAADHFEWVRAHDPANLGPLGGLAACRRCLGQHDEAFDLLEQLLQAAPNLAPALAERGRLALDMGQPAEAELWLRRALAIETNNSETAYSLFTCLSQQGKSKEADEVNARLHQLQVKEARVRDLLKEIVRSPRELNYRCELGSLFLSLGRNDEGLQLLTNVLQESPGHRAANSALAEFYQQKGDISRAQSHRRAAARANGMVVSSIPRPKK
jgi:tetratricopeptide (TPR) repeat protein